jgi:nucleoid DNA-binding protein
MNRREWVARTHRTHRALRDRPADQRPKHLTLEQVDAVIAASIETLIEALAEGKDLRLKDLGRFWVEITNPKTIVTNFDRNPQQFTSTSRKKPRYKPSSRVLDNLNGGPGK